MTFPHQRQIMVTPPPQVAFVVLATNIRNQRISRIAFHYIRLPKRVPTYWVLGDRASNIRIRAFRPLHVPPWFRPCFCDWVFSYSVNVHNPSHCLRSPSVNVNRGRRNKGHRPPLRGLAGLGFRAPVPPAPLGARVPRDHATLSPHFVHSHSSSSGSQTQQWSSWQNGH